jgi:hypothetical protein
MLTVSGYGADGDEKDVFDGWWQYPSNVVLEPSTVNLQSYSDRMSGARPTLFCGSSLETDVEIVDIRGTCLLKAPIAFLKYWQLPAKALRLSRSNFLPARMSNDTSLKQLPLQRE